MSGSTRILTRGMRARIAGSRVLSSRKVAMPTRSSQSAAGTENGAEELGLESGARIGVDQDPRHQRVQQRPSPLARDEKLALCHPCAVGMMWLEARAMAERPWTDEILDKIPSGVDVSQIEECLRLTPTERLERMRRFLLSLETARTPRGH